MWQLFNGTPTIDRWCSLQNHPFINDVPLLHICDGYIVRGHIPTWSYFNYFQVRIIQPDIWQSPKRSLTYDCKTHTCIYIYNIYYIVYIHIYILYYICVCTPFTDTYIAYIIQYHTRNSLHTVYVQHSPSLASHGFPARPRDCLDWKISAMPLTSLTAIRCSERQGDIQQQQGRHKWHKPWWLTLHSRGIATNMGKTVKQCHKPPMTGNGSLYHLYKWWWLGDGLWHVLPTY